MRRMFWQSRSTAFALVSLIMKHSCTVKLFTASTWACCRLPARCVDRYEIPSLAREKFNAEEEKLDSERGNIDTVAWPHLHLSRRRHGAASGCFHFAPWPALCKIVLFQNRFLEFFFFQHSIKVWKIRQRC